MKTLTNKLVTSVLALVLTGAALSIGVFAWFTINNTASVQNFGATLQTGEGFYMSLDGSTWTNTLDADDLATYIENVTFTAMTSTDGITMGILPSTNMPTPAAGSNYIEFTLRFAGSASYGNVQLTTLNLSSSGKTWYPGVAVPNTRSAGNSGVAITEYASNAARVSFQDILGNGEAVIYEQVVDALQDANTTGPNGNSVGFLELDNSNEAVNFYNTIMGTSLDASTISVTATSRVASDVENVAVMVAFNNQAGFTIPQEIEDAIIGDATNFNVGQVTIRIWIEGWDSEAFNAILADTLSIDFSFTGV